VNFPHAGLCKGGQRVLCEVENGFLSITEITFMLAMVEPVKTPQFLFLQLPEPPAGSA
jgi:hypothetical protein